MHQRTERLIGVLAMERLRQARVLVAGLGGVGGMCALALARGGVGQLTLVDSDAVEVSNLNRQTVAYRSTLGMPKAEAAMKQILDVDPTINISPVRVKISADNIDALIVGHDYVVDAIDDVPAKIAIASACERANIPLIASMGAGNRLDPTRFRVSDIAKTHTDPLARAVRSRLRKAGIERLTVCWSDETPVVVPPADDGTRVPASCSFVPPAAGLAIAGYVIRELIQKGSSI